MQRSLQQIRGVISALVLAAAFFAPASTAFSETMIQGQCLKSRDLKKWLATVHAEYPISSGMVNGYAVIVYGHDKTRTWTIVRFSPQGIACVLADGNELNRFTPPKVIRLPKPKGKPA